MGKQGAGQESPGAEGLPTHLERLNDAQRQAVLFGLESDLRHVPSLLIIAGAGSGKTTTLAHRVAEMIIRGVDPRRVLLLTFSRRAAMEMKRRAERIVAAAVADAHAKGRPTRATSTSLTWAGTFHSVANRLLRRYGPALGLAESFTVLDRADSEDLMDLARSRHGLAARAKRFPKKGTCMSIYSRTVNSEESLDEVLDTHFPWCAEWEASLRKLFRAYVDEKQKNAIVDYDDLLLYWFHLMQEPDLAEAVGQAYDHVFVDEYQDTNSLQAEVLFPMRPDGTGITVVGDDAQAIYGFRAATVRNILDFPRRFSPEAEVVTLEQNYRSTQPLLHAANSVIALAEERYTKDLFSERESEQKPRLVAVEDENDQALYVVEHVLGRRESGVPLKRQAVLFRTSHHSDLLEVELTRRNIPFVKFGGLKFLEAAHVKDMVALLRWAENPLDAMAAFRVLQLLPGIGPGTAHKVVDELQSHNGDWRGLKDFKTPTAAQQDFPGLLDLMVALSDERGAWPGDVGRAREWYGPFLNQIYDSPTVRTGDLEQMEQIAGQYPTRERFLTEITIDPPVASGDHAGPPHLDEDYLILSTVHSAKGQEWDSVHVLNVVDGCIPSDMSTGTTAEIEEERRLLYVAMTRAENELHLIHPQRFYVHHQRKMGNKHVYAPISRFVPKEIRGHFEECAEGFEHPADEARALGKARVDVGTRLREMW
ncbi:MAG: AAA family ATPase [Acidobacteria bacterium]|nr:AAA family ATPase [Acidobacteriota bacterium]